MADFLGVKLTSDQIETIANNCGFKKMKESVEKGKSTADENRKGFQVMNQGISSSYIHS